MNALLLLTVHMRVYVLHAFVNSVMLLYGGMGLVTIAYIIM